MLVTKSWTVPIACIVIGCIVTVALLEKAVQTPFVGGGSPPSPDKVRLAQLLSPFLRTRESAALVSHRAGSILALSTLTATLTLVLVPCPHWNGRECSLLSFLFVLFALLGVLDAICIVGFDAWTVTAALIHTEGAVGKLPTQFIALATVGALVLIISTTSAYGFYGPSFGSKTSTAIEDRKTLQRARDQAQRDLYKSIKRRWGERRGVSGSSDASIDDEEKRKLPSAAPLSRPPTYAPGSIDPQALSDALKPHIGGAAGPLRSDSLPLYEAATPPAYAEMPPPSTSRPPTPIAPRPIDLRVGRWLGTMGTPSVTPSTTPRGVPHRSQTFDVTPSSRPMSSRIVPVRALSLDSAHPPPSLASVRRRSGLRPRHRSNTAPALS